MINGPRDEGYFADLANEIMIEADGLLKKMKVFHWDAAQAVGLEPEILKALPVARTAVGDAIIAMQDAHNALLELT